MRVFFDTNVLVSAYLVSDGTCAEVNDCVLDDHTPLVNTTVVEEIERVLRDKLGVSDREVVSSLRYLNNFSVVAVPEHPHKAADALGADAYVLASAIKAGADVLVTGDKNFRSVDAELSELDICTLREFLDRYVGG